MGKIHPTAIIEDGAKVGSDVEVGPYCLVGPNVTLGDGVRLLGHVAVDGHTTLGDGTVVHPFAALGQQPQVLKLTSDNTQLVIGKNNLIREHVTMHPGTKEGRGKTTIGDNGMFMAGAHVAHDCVVGNNAIFANNATIGGHVVVEDYVNLGGLCAVHQFSRIGSYAFVGGMAGLESDLIPYGSCVSNRAYLSGLNIVGMKRRGMERETIHKLRAAYRLLFAQEGTFQERIDDVADLFGETKEVMEIIDFIRNGSSRSVCMPRMERSN